MSSCQFCNLSNGVEAANITYETQDVSCFLDIDPISEGHTLIVPKRHILDIEEADQGLRLGIINASALISAALKLIYTPDGISMMQNGGYFNDVNHYHMHVFARYKNDGFSWIDPANPKSSGLSKKEIANQLKESIIHIPSLF